MKAEDRTPACAEEPVYLTVQQAAQLIGVSPYTLRGSRYNGRLCGTTAPCWLKLGKAVRYRRADLLAWVESAAVEHRPPAPVSANTHAYA